MKQPPRRVRSMLRPLTVPASRAYGMVIAARNRKFDRGEGVQRIDRPVISIGNITTGGTGKTPMVAWIARYLLSQIREPAIAMRGYKARPGELSDEQAEYRSILPDVAIVANPDRSAALRRFLPEHAEIDCVLLDDGFQHRQLHRDLDLVLIDATASTFRDELLPAGNLREPFESLARADAVIITNSGDIDLSLQQEIDRWHGRPPLAWCRHSWTQLWITCDGTRPEPEPVSWLQGKRIVTLLGVGNPQAIIAQVERSGAHVMANIPACDHERIDVAKLATARGLCHGLDAMLVTRKDWVKVQPLLPKMGEWPVPFVVPQLEIELIDGKAALQSRLMQAVPTGRRSIPRDTSKQGGEGAAR